jgi:hypothetical protein
MICLLLNYFRAGLALDAVSRALTNLAALCQLGLDHLAAPPRSRLASSHAHWRAILIFEQLETRLTPTAFTWIGGGVNTWETPADWAGGDGRTNYPGWDGAHATTNDTVTFNNAAMTLVCGMGNDHTISTLTITGWNGRLSLTGALTIGNGGSMDSGEILNPGTHAVLSFAFGTFTCSGGNINWDPNLQPQIGNVSVYSAAEVDFTGTASNNRIVGDNITNNGTVKLANTDIITLYNRPTITNNGTILVTGNSGSLLPKTGDPIVTIQNSGTIQSTANYTIGDAVNMASSTALLYVQQQTLTITGADPSANYSLLVPTGTVQVTAATFPNGATLYSKFGVQHTGGTTKTTVGSQGFAYIDTGTKDYVLNGGTIQVGDTTPSTPTMVIKEGNLQFQSGTVQLYYDTNVTNGKWSKLSIADGNFTITQASTTLAVTFLGTSLPNTFDCMFTDVGTISSTCGTNPSGYNASRTNNNQNYTLTKKGSAPRRINSALAVGDALAAPISLWAQWPVPVFNSTRLLDYAFAHPVNPQAAPATLSQTSSWWLGGHGFVPPKPGSDDPFIAASVFPPERT